MINTETYTKKELLIIISDWLSDKDTIEVSWPSRATDQVTIIVNPDQEESYE